MTFSVFLDAVTSAARDWEDTSETIRGSARSLTDVETSVLGPRVAGAADRFLDTWIDAVQALEASARDHADTLRGTALLYAAADEDAVARAQQLLPWAQRDAAPIGGL